MAHVAIVGAGQAGASCAAALRAGGFDGTVTLYGAEPVPPYQRPPLSKAYLMGEMAVERLFLRPQAWYDQQDIVLMTDTQVTAIAPQDKTLTVDGRVVPYDDLVLTTGSRPRMLPADICPMLRGVFTMRTLADADALAPHIRAGARALIVGGGYIGLEAAAVAAKAGMHVTLLEAAPRVLARVAAPPTSQYFKDLHTGHGVEIRENAVLDHVRGKDGRIVGAVLADGTNLDVDLLIVGIGIVPDIRLAAAAGLAIDNGIAVDAMCRTSDPHVWAAGDCACFLFRGHRVRLESVQNAIEQAEAAAANILGAETPYDPLPWFWSDQYDVKLQIAGLNMGYDRVHVRPGEGQQTSHWYYAGGRLIAVDAMNDSRAYMVGKRLIEMGKSPDPAAVVDPEMNVKTLLKA